MATAVTRPTSGTKRNLLAAPSRLPFPTSPSVPDRRARLRRVNLNKANGGPTEQGGPGQPSRSDILRRLGGGNLATHVNLATHSNLFSGHENTTTIDVSLRKSHRNIVTSKSHRNTEFIPLTTRPPSPSHGGAAAHEAPSTYRPPSSLRPPSSHRPRATPRPRSARRRSRSRAGKPERLRLPSIGQVKTVELTETQGVFLTALAYEDSPMPTDRHGSISSRSSKGEEKTSTDLVPAEQLPAIDTSRDNLTGRSTVARNTTGLQRVYLEGLEYMRGHVGQVEEEAERINREFHKVESQDYHQYLIRVNELLLEANAGLRKNNVALEVIDSDTRLVRMLNALRAGKHPDMELVDPLTTYWTELKSTTAALQMLLDKFNTTVLQRLRNNYISSHSAELLVPVCQQYALDIEDFLKTLETQTGNASLVLKSYDNKLNLDLISPSPFLERLMLTCDTKAFPILGVVYDVCTKIFGMCETARKWLSRDEQFMHEMNTFIRETRPVARKRELVLQTEKQKQKRVEKNFRIVQNVLTKNREKLQLIEAELKELEQKMNRSREEQKARINEIHQKENMVDFLKITAQQTKRNYTLQSKKMKLLRQVKDLEDYLRLMESDLEVVQDRILAKSHERIILTDKISSSEQSYGVLKTDLDKFSEHMEELEAEVTCLSGQLLQMEIVHTIRTSPETLDNLVDRPSTVKLSKSLQDRIKERKRKAAIKSS